MKRYLSATFASLAYRNYRLYFLGQSVSTIGTWAQKVSQAWLVLELTGSGTLLGITVALQALPTLLIGAWAGVWVDRLDRRRMLMFTQSFSIVPALALGIMTSTGTATFWAVLVAAGAIGTIEAFDKPTRQSLASEMVEPRHLVNAITLNNIVLNAGRLVGPAIAGVLIVGVGLSWGFFINAMSFAVSVAAIGFMRSDLMQPVVRAPRARGQLIEGLKYVRSEPGLLGPLILLAVTGLLAWEWNVTLPLLARDAFDGDAQVAGWMLTAMGAGAIIGALAIAGALRATNTRLILTSLVFAGLLLLVAAAPWLSAALALLFLLGTAGVAYRTITTSMAQLRSAPEMRGRVVALFLIAVGGMSPIDAPLLGWLCEVIGPRLTLALGGIATIVTATIVGTMLRRHRARAEAAEDAPTDPPAAAVVDAIGSVETVTRAGGPDERRA